MVMKSGCAVRKGLEKVYDESDDAEQNEWQEVDGRRAKIRILRCHAWVVHACQVCALSRLRSLFASTRQSRKVRRLFLFSGFLFFGRPSFSRTDEASQCSSLGEARAEPAN